MENTNKKNVFKTIFTYFYTVISWTLFIILILIGVLLIYYFIASRMYAKLGDRFEPKFSVYTIVSPSMEPTINVYDVIVNTKINSIDDVKVNDVITFISTWEVTNGMTVTHRVVGSKVLDDGSKCLITRGDNNTNNDQSCVKEGNIIGITKGVIPGLGRIQFFLSSSFGWLLIVILPALYVIVKDILKILNLSKEVQEEERAKKKKAKELYNSPDNYNLKENYRKLDKILRER